MTSGRIVKSALAASEARAWIGGDCWLQPGGAQINLARLWGEASPFICVVNLECSSPVGPLRQGRRALLPLDAERLSELAGAKNTICVLANNHATDFGSAGLVATLKEVHQAGFPTVGAGSTLSEACEPVLLDVAGRRFGLLAYADTRPHVGAVPATERTPGVAPLDPALVLRNVQALAERVDDLWLFLHWGRENIRYPEPEQRTLARAFAEAGATLIVGTHPHVVQGWEQVGSTPVYYSLGNFVFPPILLTDGTLLRWNRENQQGVALSGEMGGDGWRWSPVPYLLSKQGFPVGLQDGRQEPMRRSLALLSQPFGGNYARRYPRLRWKELLLYNVRRLAMMSWRERLRLPGRLVQRVFQHAREPSPF